MEFERKLTETSGPLVRNLLQSVANPRKLLLAASLLLGLSWTWTGAHAQVLTEFNFENFAVGQVVGGQSFSLNPALLTATHDMANNGVEDFGPPNFKLSMTRFAGAVNFPEMTFTTTVPMRLDSIAFLHIHNHNPSFPTFPNYQVDLKLDSGSGYVTIATFLAAPGGYISGSFPGPGVLPPGTYGVRWIPIPNFGPDTNTEFFGLDNIRLIGALDSDDDGVFDDRDLCPGTTIPESVPTVGLKPNHFALVNNDQNFDTVSTGNGKGPGRSYTTTDTAGCSCEQIIEAQGLGNGHMKGGCSISAMDDWVSLVNP